MKNFYKKTIAWAIISLLIVSSTFAYTLSPSEIDRGNNIKTKLIELINSKPTSTQLKFKTKLINSLNSLKNKMSKDEKTISLIDYVILGLNNQASTPANANWEIPYSDCTKAWQTFTANSTYSDPVAWICNTPDKVICTRNGFAQVWSMCNAWTSTSWTSSSSYGWYYQWWNNWDISSSPVSTTQPVACSSVNDSSYSSSANFISPPYFEDNWCYGSLNNNVWGNSTDKSVAWNATNPSARKWPCAVWYHVPSTNQWQYAYNNGFPNIQTILSLSLAWFRSRYGWMTSKDIFGYYWSSSPNNEKAYNLSFTSTSINPSDIWNRLAWNSVRCIKD